MTESTARNGNGTFGPGNAGRPKGARGKLQESFWKDFAEVWQTAGKAALEHIAANDQATFARVAASIMPKETEVTLRKVIASELGDDELAGIIRSRSGNGASETPLDPSVLH